LASTVADSSINTNIITDGNKFTRGYPNIYLGKPDSSIEIDLGREFNIYKCVMYNRSDCCQDKIDNTKVQLLSSDKSYNIYSFIINPYYFNELEVFFISDRYIKLQAANSGDHYLQIACYDYNEVNIAFGKSAIASSYYGKETKGTWKITDGDLSAQNYPNIYHSNYATGDYV
jgi:hypothetical protein